MRIAIDTGGTFTDIVYFQNSQLVVLKVFSTPSDPGRAVIEGLHKISPGANVVVRHGTTVATNAMLERKGARVAFLTTKGFEDTLGHVVGVLLLPETRGADLEETETLAIL